jgi:hypothetical protein
MLGRPRAATTGTPFMTTLPGGPGRHERPRHHHHAGVDQDLTGVAATVVLQTGRDLAIVAGILAAGVLYEAVYLRPRRDTHWLLLEPLVSEPAGDDQAVLPKPDDLGTSP